MNFKDFKRNRGKLAKTAEKLKDKKSNFNDERFWSLTPDKTGNADVILRFLPQKDIELEPIIMRYTHFTNENGKYFVELCPNTWGWDHECPADEYAQPFWDEDTNQSKTIASNYGRKKQYISNVLIIKDLNKPENNGKVFLYKFGSTVFSKIMDKIMPESELDTPSLVYDLWEGRDFKLKVRQKGGWANYDNSAWFEQDTPIAKSDVEIENIYNQIYDLDEFINEKKNRKSYAELKKRFIEVVGEKAARFFSENKSDVDAGDTGTENSIGNDNTEEESFDVDTFNAMEDEKSDVNETAVGESPNKTSEEVAATDEDDLNFDDFNEDDFNFDSDDD